MPPLPDVVSHYIQMLDARVEESRLRSLREIEPHSAGLVRVNGRPLVDFASNDYLGLAHHPLLIERSIQFTQRFGVGSTASRLLSGNISPFESIERKLAALKGTEAALLLPTGFQANSTVLSALADRGTLLLCDRLSHQSLLTGAQISHARWARYEHNDCAELDAKFCAHPAFERRIVATESVFSMDGDIADLDDTARVATANGALLYVDEAHATGVFGPLGMGLTAGRSDVAIAMGTFGKAGGSFGAYVACSQQLRDFLINFCSGLIYSTALPPPVLGAIDAALDVIPTMERQRVELLSNAEHLRARLHQLGFDTGQSASQIIPIIVGSDSDTVNLAAYLESNGFFAPAIRPPTVPDGTARIRLSLTTQHTREQLERLCVLLRDWRAH